MATARQIEANRRNAQRSTGPRTTEGKHIARYNAFKHGLAANTILPHEDPAEYHEMRAALIETWQPANAQELMQVDAIAMGFWCMQRSARFEKRMFELQLQHMKTIHHAATTAPHPDDDGGIVASFCNRDNDKSYELLFRYDTRAASKYYRAIDCLMKLQSFRVRMQREQTKAVNKELASFGEAPPDSPVVPEHLESPGVPTKVSCRAATPADECGDSDRRQAARGSGGISTRLACRHNRSRS